jgi:hypothetical protein
VISLLACLLVTGAMTVDQQPALDALVEISMPDQHGDRHRVSDEEGGVVVVIVVTAKRLRNVRPWERHLRERFDDIRTIRIADLPATSKATLESVSARLRERVPEGVSVLIDTDRLWASRLELDTGRPNLLIIDRDGRLVTSVRGLYTPELGETVIGELERLLSAP